MEDHMEIEIDYKGKKEIVKLKRLSWKDNNDALREATKLSKEGNAKYDLVTHQEFRLLKSIETAPFPVKMESLWELDVSVGDALFQAMLKLNELTPEAQKNLKSPLMQKESSVEK